MKSVKWLLILSLLIGSLQSCKDDEDPDQYNTISGSQSSIGDVDNSVSFSAVYGASNIQSAITDLTDGISTITSSATISDSTYLSWARMMPGVNVNGNVISGTRKYRITEEGIESIYDDGQKMVLIHYDAPVGTKWTLNRDGRTWVREVGRRSESDDYYWNGMYIKTVDVETNEFNFPGVSYFEFFFNHRFGLVAVRVHFENGLAQTMDVMSSNTN